MQTNLARTYIVEVGVGLWLWCNVASITSLNAWLVMCRARSNWAVPTLSNVKDCILDMCTPKSRWIPLHSMHTIMPKFVESHVASMERRRIPLVLYFYKSSPNHVHGYYIQNLPFCDEQSQHWSFPGNLMTHRITACWSSTKLGFPVPASALPLASNARSRARSLQFTKTDIHALWSASSSAWKWYVLLSATNERQVQIYQSSISTNIFRYILNYLCNNIWTRGVQTLMDTRYLFRIVGNLALKPHRR